MKTIWQVNVDRYADESRAKSEDGGLFSIVATAEELIERYKRAKIKPELQVVDIGLGSALSDYLKDMKIPHTAIRGIIMRVGGADVIMYKGEEK